MKTHVRQVLSVLVLVGAAGCDREATQPKRASADDPSARKARPNEARPARRDPAPIDNVIRELPDLSVPARLVKGPWADAAVGQSVRFRGPGGLRLVHKVVKVDEDTVTITTTTRVDGLDASLETKHPRRVPEGGAREVPPDARWGEQTLRLAGRDLACRVASWVKTRRNKGAVTYRVWFCDDVPGRIVRTAREDADGKETVTLELTDLTAPPD